MENSPHSGWNAENWEYRGILCAMAKKAANYLYSHNRENYLYNTAITQETLLDRHPGQGMQN